jgi:BclB C-terminal domain-containing protein
MGHHHHHKKHHKHHHHHHHHHHNQSSSSSSSSSSSEVIEVIHVEKGPRGHRGHRGHDGVTGFIGATGFQGFIGLSGTTGLTGATGFIGETGFMGATGFNGTTGFMGATGPTGQSGTTGFTGATGPIASGAIIPLSSGTPSTMTVSSEELAETASLIAYGINASGAPVIGTTIDLTGGSATLLNMAFSAPRDGILNSLSAFFSNTSVIDLQTGSTTIIAQLYTASPITTPNTFTQIPGAVITLGPLVGLLSLGTTSNGITTGLSIPILAENRYLFACSATTSGVLLQTTISGYISGGLNIV